MPLLGGYVYGYRGSTITTPWGTVIGDDLRVQDNVFTAEPDGFVTFDDNRGVFQVDTEQVATALVPCHRCGAEADLVVITGGSPPYLKKGVYAKCFRCGLEGAATESRGRAIYIWNQGMTLAPAPAPEPEPSRAKRPPVFTVTGRQIVIELK
jgi:hypothetical protein